MTSTAFQFNCITQIVLHKIRELLLGVQNRNDGPDKHNMQLKTPKCHLSIK